MIFSVLTNAGFACCVVANVSVANANDKGVEDKVRAKALEEMIEYLRTYYGDDDESDSESDEESESESESDEESESEDESESESEDESDDDEDDECEDISIGRGVYYHTEKSGTYNVNTKNPNRGWLVQRAYDPDREEMNVWEKRVIPQLRACIKKAEIRPTKFLVINPATNN